MAIKQMENAILSNHEPSQPVIKDAHIWFIKGMAISIIVITQYESTHAKLHDMFWGSGYVLFSYTNSLQPKSGNKLVFSISLNA